MTLEELEYRSKTERLAFADKLEMEWMTAPISRYIRPEPVLIDPDDAEFETVTVREHARPDAHRRRMVKGL